jgi:hypothetical protein
MDMMTTLMPLLIAKLGEISTAENSKIENPGDICAKGEIDITVTQRSVKKKVKITLWSEKDPSGNTIQWIRTEPVKAVT